MDAHAGMTTQAGEGGSGLHLSRARRYYILALITIICTCSTVDRQMMNILIEPIRKEMHLSDTQMGLLTGIAFAIVNIGASIPAARLADRWSRRNLIAIAVSFWSLLTILTGVTANFFQLFLARIGVGFGEAGGNAPCYATVGELFPRQYRATAMAVVMMSPALGMAIGLFWGGYALQHYGWRTAFYVAGGIGLILGPLILLTTPEIPKGHSDGTKASRQLPLMEVMRQIWRTRTIALMLGAAMFQTVFSMGLSTWLPAFLARSHHMEASKIGAGLGLALGAGSLFGNLIGGFLIDALIRRKPGRQFMIPIICAPISTLLAAGALWLPIGYVFPLLALQALIGSLFGAAIISTVLTLSPVSARATATALVTFILSGIAMGLGPLVIGAVSDLLHKALGEESLRWSLLSMTLLVIPAVILYYLAGRRYPIDLALVDARDHVAEH